MSSSDSPVSEYEEYSIVPRQQTRRKPSSNNETIKKLLLFVLVLFSALIEMSSVNPLFQNSISFFSGKDENNAANVITDNHGEQIEKHINVYQNMITEFEKAHKGIKAHIDTKSMIDVLSDTLPSLGSDNYGDVLFEDFLRDGTVNPDYFPDTHADVFSQHVEQITSTIAPVNSAFGRLEGVNTNTTSFIKDNLDKIDLKAPFMGKITFTKIDEFPIDDGAELFSELKSLTDEIVTLLGTMFTSMIHVYQTHMYFYSGSITYILNSVLDLQQDDTLLLTDSLLRAAKELRYDKDNLSGMFTVTTATNTPPVKLDDAVQALTKISETAVVKYNNDNTKPSPPKNLNDILINLKKIQNRFVEVSYDKNKVNKYADEIQKKTKEMSTKLVKLIKLFESRKDAEGKLGKNVNAFLYIKPFVSIETSSRETVKLMFNDFYKFLIQQIIYSVFMMGVIKMFDNQHKNSLLSPMPGTSNVIYPRLKKFLGLYKTRTRRMKRRGKSKPKSKATKKKSRPKSKATKKKSKGKKGK